MWKRALSLAEQTPEQRNRYVDFLRALSILAVVIGHWIISAPYFTEAGARTLPHILDLSPWTHWLTWLFQVMPVFFFVGGYSNFTAWEAALRKGDSYAKWLAARLHRLLFPVLPLIFVWAGLAFAGQLMGLSDRYIQVASQVAIVPTWFIAVYILVVLFVPVSYRFWKQAGILSILPLAVLAAVVDWGYFSKGWESLAWINYLLIWLTIHQLGFAWREGMFGNRALMIFISILGLSFLYMCVTLGPYPLSLVGVPGDDVSNTLPPKIPLLFLALVQVGICMSLEPLMNRVLSRRGFWALVILINAMIMTIFLWHSTAMMFLIGAVFLVEPTVFSVFPGTSEWWIQRPLWLAVYTIVMIPLLLIFSRFEMAKPAEIHPRVGYLFLGCVITSAGIAYFAQNGFGSAPHWSMDAFAVTLVVLGTVLAGVLRRKQPGK